MLTFGVLLQWRGRRQMVEDDAARTVSSCPVEISAAHWRRRRYSAVRPCTPRSRGVGVRGHPVSRAGMRRDGRNRTSANGLRPFRRQRRIAHARPTSKLRAASFDARWTRLKYTISAMVRRRDAFFFPPDRAGVVRTGCRGGEWRGDRCCAGIRPRHAQDTAQRSKEPEKKLFFFFFFSYILNLTLIRHGYTEGARIFEIKSPYAFSRLPNVLRL